MPEPIINDAAPGRRRMTEEEREERAAENARGIVITKVPGQSEAELVGATTDEEKAIVQKMLDNLST